MSAMPVMIVILCVGAIAYRYYSAFLAARVAALDDARVTPAHRHDDGQNFHPTSKWVLFGHHFAAISGAGPLIGPVLAAQFGYLPGLLWIVIGVCLAGAVQDFLVLGMSVRHDGKSLAQIAYAEAGRLAGTAATVAILCILVIALAGLGKVVVKALGGEAVGFPPNSTLIVPANVALVPRPVGVFHIPAGSRIEWNGGQSTMPIADAFDLRTAEAFDGSGGHDGLAIRLPADAVRLVPGSSWGFFTIACTIPIALFVGLWMNRLRPGHVVEASVIGGALTLGATVLGGVVSQSSYAHLFNFSANGITWAMAAYGFVAAVLPVWVLLVPRDYLSSFLKIGTIAALVVGTLIANPRFEAPAVNHVFATGGPIVRGALFPFLFITIMCGAISGFHALISSGTTSKMLARESDARTIGYGAMLIEGLVAAVAMIAAAALPTRDYYAMNTELAAVPAYNDRILAVGGGGGVEHLAQYESLTQESLRGRTGGAVTLAVGMAHIFDDAARSIAGGTWLNAMWKYWYHFAIMFEALFILTTIDAGTRVGRFLLQEVAGKIHPRLGLAGGWPSAIGCTALMVGAWVYFLGSGSFATIWAIFGLANQSLAVIALAIVTAYLCNSGRARYAWVTLAPMCVVYTTTTWAAIVLLIGQIDAVRAQLAIAGWNVANAKLFNAALQATLNLAMLGCVLAVIAGVLRSALWPRVATRPR